VIIEASFFTREKRLLSLNQQCQGTEEI